MRIVKCGLKQKHGLAFGSYLAHQLDVTLASFAPKSCEELLNPGAVTGCLVAEVMERQAGNGSALEANYTQQNESSNAAFLRRTSNRANAMLFRGSKGNLIESHTRKNRTYHWIVPK